MGSDGSACKNVVSKCFISEKIEEGNTEENLKDLEVMIDSSLLEYDLSKNLYI
jgi:hypothetical protein